MGSLVKQWSGIKNSYSNKITAEIKRYGQSRIHDNNPIDIRLNLILQFYCLHASRHVHGWK